MGNTKAATTTRKTKKKGRPSLLDLQRRSLRLQQQREQQCDPGSDDDPRLRDSAAAVADDDEESDHGRREKKLRLVLRLHNNPNAADSAVSGSESDDRRSRNLGAGGNGAETERQNPTSKVTDLPQDFGPTTPFPDKKLLVFILDRLQKKDTYGVFAEPVDPEELPDYHDIIKHPMDFATVRKKLSDGAYTNLEQFEKDVFLISSNAMQYNAPDTIYYRQARAIQELAKKNFDNLRQESDDNDEEPKPARRGRPPTKNIFKKLGRPTVDNVCSNVSSNATLANAGDNHQSTNLLNNLFHTGLDKTKLTNLPTKPYALRNTEPHSFPNEHTLEREDNSGSAYKSGPLKYLKKSFVMDENRRSTYTLPEVVNSLMVPSVLTTFDGERKQLIPVGLYTEHVYARSLARFAAKLGPIAWEIAAKRIERLLPPGTKFGRGWIGEKEALQQSHPLPSKSPNSSQPENLATTSASASEHASDDAAIEVNTGSSSPAMPLSHPRRSIDSAEVSARSQASSLKPHNAVGLHGMWQKTGNQLPQVVGLGFNRLSQVGNTVKVSAASGSFSSEATILHSHTSTDMLSRTNIQASTSNLNTDSVYSVTDPSTSSVSGSHLPDGPHDSQGIRRVTLMPKSVSISPDLNLGFQSTGSPVSGVRLDSKNPNLALGL
ncbi:uncharacterized protein LOC121997270 isoform X1 [Zingiber officinale]|uniref:uncharacterized protein LOC121997270 isoform X1 n=1 Tax=Zingiber officinale TaxID=94328 RepID=UPI001C4BC9A4|nr:uncharacterized protein LOC121997270 isoform X1 [Zingiber officinale]